MTFYYSETLSKQPASKILDMSSVTRLLRHRFLRFLLSRLAFAAICSVVVAGIVFFAIRSMPGDPTLLILGLESTEEQRAELATVMGLDQPLINQFFIWLGQLFHGDLGQSFSQARPVTAVIAPALGNTLKLAGLASGLAILIGFLMGNLATSRWRVARRSCDVAEALFLSAPQYSVALILLICFAVLLPIFPAGGMGGRSGISFLALVLPAVSLSLAPGAQMGRSLKTSIASMQATELVPSLIARGLSRGRILVHLHHNALPPMVTVLGIQVGGMLGNALFVEMIFSLPGMGNLLVQSVSLRDYQLVQGVSLTLAIGFVLVLLIADVINALLDPRLRVGEK
jgi:peptide/nickel transport system permease protein